MLSFNRFVIFLFLFVCFSYSVRGNENPHYNYFIKFKDDVEQTQINHFFRKNSSLFVGSNNPFKCGFDKLKKVYEVSYRNIKDVEIVDKDLLEYLEQIPRYDFFYIPDDYSSTQWNLDKINAEQAWDISTGNNTIIAVIDDALDINHSDLLTNVFSFPLEIPNNNIDDDGNGFIDDVNGYDFADGDSDISPPSGGSVNLYHGTHCAGIAAASTDNNTGISSIGFNAKILGVKIGSSSTGGLSNAYLGVDYAIANNVDVISMSWGGSGYSQTYQLLFDAAYANNIVCVAAAGNYNSNLPMYPASYNNVVSVASTDINDVKSSFSSYGTNIDLSAPGSGIYSTLLNDSYGNLSGTSMACPLVSGVAALIISKGVNFTVDNVVHCLKSGADNIDGQNPSFLNALGAGRINAHNSMICASSISAEFAASETDICPGTSVTFTNNSTNAVSYLWNFPGAIPSTSTLVSPTVIYPSAGNYSVSLTAYGSPVDSVTTIWNNYISVGTPSATLSGTTTIPSGYSAFLTFNFTGNAPYNLVYTDGTNNFTVSNIQSSSYSIPVNPASTTNYNIISYNTVDCVGSFSGNALVTVIPPVSSNNSCIDINGFTKISDTSSFFSGNLDNGDFFGQACKKIGDVDGDGVIDIAVCSGKDDDGGPERGAFYIYFLNTDGTVKGYQKISDTQGGFTGALSDGDRFGVYLGSIGDLNGDGIPDLGVNGRFDDDGATDAGALWLVYLNANGTVQSSQKISMNSGGMNTTWSGATGFGSGATNIGDLNGDGFDDLVVSGTRDTDGGGQNGAIWVLFMNGSGTVSSFQKISETQGGLGVNLDNLDYFGHGLDLLGDINNDGRIEIVTSAPLDDDGGNNKGAVYIISLNNDGTVFSTSKISDTQGNFNNVLSNGANFGVDVQVFGDVNNDGINDIIVGAPKMGGTGSAIIILISSTGSALGYKVINSSHPNLNGVLGNADDFGYAVGSLGDLNSDGVIDFMISARRDDDNGFDKGAIYLFAGIDTCQNQTINCDLDAVITNSNDLCSSAEVIFYTNNSTSSAPITSATWTTSDGFNYSNLDSITHQFYGGGSYQVELILGDANGCVDTASLIVNIDPPSVSNDTTYKCLNSYVRADLGLNCIDTANYSISWSPSIGISDTSTFFPIINYSGEITYNITIWNYTDTLVTQYTVLNDSTCCQTPLAINHDDQVCLNETINFSVSNGISGANYFWNFGAGSSPSTSSLTSPANIQLNNLGSNQVILIYTDTCGIDTLFSTVYINPLPEFIVDDTIFCDVGNNQIDSKIAGNVTVEWSPGNLVLDSVTVNPNFIGNQDTTLKYSVTDNFTGCTYIDSVHVGVFDYDRLSDTLFCEPNEYIIQNPKPDNQSIEWSQPNLVSNSGSFNPIYLGDDNSYLVYQLYDSVSKCTVVDSLYVTIQESFPLASDTLFCDTVNNSLVTNIPSSYYVDWSPSQVFNDNNSLTPIFISDTSMLVSYLAYDSVSGCQWLDTISVTIFANQKPFTAFPDSLCQDSAYNIKLNNLYNFTINGSAYDYPIYNLINESELVIEYSNLCYNDADSIKIFIENCDCQFILPNVFTPNKDGVNETLNFQLENCDGFHYKIFNRWGQLVASSNLTFWDGYTVGGKLAPEGTYYYLVTIDEKVYSRSFVLYR